jgi:hypothetical protein
VGVMGVACQIIEAQKMELVPAVRAHHGTMAGFDQLKDGHPSCVVSRSKSQAFCACLSDLLGCLVAKDVSK